MKPNREICREKCARYYLDVLGKYGEICREDLIVVHLNAKTIMNHILFEMPSNCNFILEQTLTVEESNDCTHGNLLKVS